MPRDLAETALALQELLEDGALRNLQAQAHARTMLNQLGTSADDWHQFTEELDERLLYGAHVYLVRGMELIDIDSHAALGSSLLFRGAETLEFITDSARGPISRFEERLNAALAYHVSGHHARSYVIADRLAEEEHTGRGPDGLATSLLALLRRDLRSLSTSCLKTLGSQTSQDQGVSKALREGALDDDDAIGNLGRRSLSEALLSYLEYAKRGQAELLVGARAQCRVVSRLGQEAGHVDLWWLGLAVERLLRDLGNSSLWSGLRDLCPTSPYGGAIDRYIESSLRAETSIVTLWPSQRKALGMIKTPGAPSFCIRMPTSAGKTKIAEFCILRTMLEAVVEDDARCLYIAPFRSLAVEVESTLSKGLRPLGIRVSEIYGGFDLTVADERLIRETQVMVATPEKIDAAVRLVPDLLDSVRLVIIDEGHIAGSRSERGIRAEFLINRLLWRLGRDNCRHVFISAVLPNADEFASWIGGSADRIVESDWRPSRLVLGECEWSRTRGDVRLSFTHEGSQRLETDVLIQPFVRVRGVRGVPGAGRRRNAFPHDTPEAFAACVLRFAQYGTTLAFVPQARQVDSNARVLVKASHLMKVLSEADGETWKLPAPDGTTRLMREAIDAMGEELGEGSEPEWFLRHGIAIHRGNLPAGVRIAVERLIRAGEIRIIVATTTLAQGVNLPIRTVLVRGLQQGQDSVVDAMTFWNIAGRAGRALCENEGQVLFFNDIERDRLVVRRQRQAAAAIVDRSAVEQVVGLLYRILKLLVHRWRIDAPDLDLPGLALRLAENDFEWVERSRRPGLKEFVALIDQHLLAVAVEGGFGPADLDLLQEVLRESLLYAQLGARPVERLDETAARDILAARLRWVFARVPHPTRREQFYRMGMSLGDCETIEAATDELLTLVEQAHEWQELTLAQRLELLMSFAVIASRVKATSEAVRTMPPDALDIVRAWLQGKRCVQIVADGLGEELEHDAGQLGRFLEEYCVYGLAWAVSGLISFAKEELQAEGAEGPVVLDHLPAMFKIGVSDPLAAVFAPYIQMDRALAMTVAKVCPYGLTEIPRAIAWLHAAPAAELTAKGLSAPEVDVLRRKQRQLPDFEPFEFEDGAMRWSVKVRSAPISIGANDRLVVVPRPDQSPAHYDLVTLSGKRLGNFRRSTGELPPWWNDPLSTDVRVENVDLLGDGGVRVALNARELAI